MAAFCVFGPQLAYSKKGPKQMPPGLAKKKELPPGLAKKKELPPGLAKRQETPEMPIEEEETQKWCLEQQGKVNFVLPDNTICDCLTETHAVALASEEDWIESVGKSLHHALTTEKKPGILLFLKKDEEHPYVLQLDNVIEHFELPITIWKVEIEREAEQDEDSQ
jgi:hypothetical protein